MTANDGEHTATSLSSSIISHTKPSSTTTTTTTDGNSERVLRYGESIDSLFCLVDNNNKKDENENEKEEMGDRMHRNLCHEICMGSKGNDAFAWVKALELSLNRAAGVRNSNRGRGGGGEEEEGVETISDIGKLPHFSFRFARSLMLSSTQSTGFPLDCIIFATQLTMQENESSNSIDVPPPASNYLPKKIHSITNQYCNYGFSTPWCY